MKEILWATLSSDAYWSVNKNIAKNIGIEEAVFLSDLISKEKYFHSKNQLDDKGGFFNTTENLINDLGISERSKKRIQALLIKLNIVSVKKRGVPAKNYWYLNHNEIIKIMSSSQVIFSQTDGDPTGQDCIDLTGQTDGDPAINKNKLIKIKNNNKELFINEHKIIEYWNTKNKDGKAEPVKPNKRTLDLIRATLNQYSEQELKAAIDELYKDKWSIDNKQIRLNRLIKPDKRDQNMHRYRGEYHPEKTFPDWQNMTDQEIQKIFNNPDFPFQTHEILPHLPEEIKTVWKSKGFYFYGLSELLINYKRSLHVSHN